jgi:hypothetical protein
VFESKKNAYEPAMIAPALHGFTKALVLDARLNAAACAQLSENTGLQAALLQFLDENGVLALVAGAQTGLPAVSTFSVCASSARAKAWRMHELTRAALVALDQALTQAHIPALIYKGAALAESHYPHPAARSRVDTDLWLAPEHVASAHQILLAQGFSAEASNFSAVVLPERSYLRSDHGAVVRLDLHWRCSARPWLSAALSFPQIWAQALPMQPFQALRQPDPPDALLLSVVHLYGHHRNLPRWIWLLDMHLLWQAMAPEPQRMCIERARQRGILCLLQAGLQAANACFDTDIAQAMQARAPRPEAARAFLQPNSMWLDVRLGSWRERAQIVQGRLLATPELLHARFGAYPAWQQPFMQVRRWLFAARGVR